MSTTSRQTLSATTEIYVTDSHFYSNEILQLITFYFFMKLEKNCNSLHKILCYLMKHSEKMKHTTKRYTKKIRIKKIRKIVFEIGNPQAFFLCKRKNSQNPNDHLQPRISKNGKKKIIAAKLDFSNHFRFIGRKIILMIRIKYFLSLNKILKK